MSFQEVECTGKPPEPRFYHAMQWYPKGNLLIVYGGKRFANPDPSLPVSEKSEFANSVHVLRMDTLVWYAVKWR